MQPYRRRVIDAMLDELLAGLPAVMLVGPRAGGKTTTARQRVRSVVRLDRDNEAAAFRADPDAALAAFQEPLLLDEWQMVPEVLPALKRAVDDGDGAGRFLITGSVRAEKLDAAWAATGRVVRVEQWGMNRRELDGDAGAPSLFDRLRQRGLKSLVAPRDPPDLTGYIELALRGMFPEVALQPSDTLRSAWLAAYVDQLVRRDAAQLGDDRDPIRLRRYLVAVASNTAGVVDHRTLYEAAGIARMTASAYDSLLELLYVTERVPAWYSNRLVRLVKGPKRYIIEPALLGPLLGVDPLAVLRDGRLLGLLVDTFVVAQLRPEVACAWQRPTLHHLRRDDGGREIDLVVEWPDGKVLGIEVKASSAPTQSDARHLVWLADQLGEQWIGGVVLHTGPRLFRLGPSVVAAPIASLWS